MDDFELAIAKSMTQTKLDPLRFCNLTQTCTYCLSRPS